MSRPLPVGLVVCMVALLGGCRAEATTATPTADDGAYLLRFDPASMDGASCSLYVATTTGLQSHRILVASEFEFSSRLADGELQLSVHRVRAESGVKGYTKVSRITPELVERFESNRQVVRKAADDDDAQRTIALLQEHPHAFVRLDDHAGIIEYRDDFDPALGISSLEGLGLAWLFGMPHLPVAAVRAGDEWSGVRPPPTAAKDIDRLLPLKYRLRGVRRGIATIELKGLERDRIFDTPKGKLRLSLEAEGLGRVRAADGALIDANVDGMLWIATEKGSLTLRWRLRTTCRS